MPPKIKESKVFKKSKKSNAKRNTLIGIGVTAATVIIAGAVAKNQDGVS